MWESFLAGAQYAGYAAGWIALVLLCFVGFFLAMIGISGMWMVVAAAVIGLFLTQSGRPTVLDVCVCAGISAAVDVTEWFAGMWGVRRRGGSRLAALMASLGGIGGALLGFLIPVPVIGNLLGMLIGSFLLAFLVEHRRLQRVGAATHIAFGATLACIAVVILKVCVTLGMALWLADVPMVRWIMNALLKRVSLFSIVVAFAIGGFAVAAQGEGIEFSKQEREQLDRALQAMNATVADLGFAKDLGEPRSALKWIRETLEEPLQLNRVGQELWDCAQQDDASNWWSFARRRLELEPISELSISDAITPSVWSNAAPVLADALMQFYAGAQLANLLLDRAFEKLTSEQMQYLAASAFASALNLEDEKASRDALRDAGVEQALIEQMLADSKQLDETPSAEMLLSASERLDRSALLEAGRVFQGAVQTFAEVVRDFTDWPEETLRWETPFGAIVILGRGVNVFDEAALLVVNPGSDTTYRGAAGSANGLSRNRLAAIVDFDGDDLYVGNELLGPGAALFGAAVVLDFNGSDTWRCDFAGTGAGLWGVGWIEDAGGNDIYDARALSQGAAIAGVGVLLDRAGNDSYRVGWQGQGFAGWMGFGLLLDRAGADRYFAGGYVLDYERNPDRYLSLSQGFSIGQRPFSGGGIGALLDLEGNDVYDADVFAQGVSYYYSAGFLLDGSGHDRYSVHHYGQGCGIHLSLGLLVDVAGDDVYKGSTLTQGAAHDFAVGGLMDRGGDDTYIAKQNSQGHGMNNSVGWLLDAAGDDVYEGRDSDSTQGIGNTGGTRESGSIGLLLDLGGTDRYSSPGVNDRLLLRPNYGALYDVNSVSVREGEE